MFKKLQKIANFLFGWIAEAIRISVLQGQGSRWNFGSYFGLTFEDFLSRIYPVVQGNPYWSALSGFVRDYDAVTAQKGTLATSFVFYFLNSHPFKDFEFILNCAAHASNAQAVRHTHTRLLYGTEPYTFIEKSDTVEKFDLTEKLKGLSI